MRVFILICVSVATLCFGMLRADVILNEIGAVSDARTLR